MVRERKGCRQVCKIQTWPLRETPLAARTDALLPAPPHPRLVVFTSIPPAASKAGWTKTSHGGAKIALEMQKSLKKTTTATTANQPASQSVCHRGEAAVKVATKITNKQKKNSTKMSKHCSTPACAKTDKHTRTRAHAHTISRLDRVAAACKQSPVD